MDTEGWFPLHDASWRGDLDVVRALLERGADIEAAEFRGKTSLHSACLTGQTGVVRELLTRGADIEAREADVGRTPLIMASEYGHYAVVRVLLAAGANRLHTDAFGRTALSFAVVSARGQPGPRDAICALLAATTI